MCATKSVLGIKMATVRGTRYNESLISSTGTTLPVRSARRFARSSTCSSLACTYKIAMRYAGWFWGGGGARGGERARGEARRGEARGGGGGAEGRQRVDVVVQVPTISTWCYCVMENCKLLYYFSFSHTSTSQLRDKPCSQVSSLIPPGSCLQFLTRIGFSNPTARRFFIEFC